MECSSYLEINVIVSESPYVPCSRDTHGSETVPTLAGHVQASGYFPHLDRGHRAVELALELSHLTLIPLFPTIPPTPQRRRLLSTPRLFLELAT